MLFLLNTRGNLKYFKIRTIPLRIYENFEDGLVDTKKKYKILNSPSIGLNDV